MPRKKKPERAVRKFISIPESWKDLFELKAKQAETTLSEWLCEGGLLRLTAEEREALPDRPRRGRRWRNEDS